MKTCNILWRQQVVASTQAFFTITIPPSKCIKKSLSYSKVHARTHARTVIH